MKAFPLLLLLWPSAALAQINENFEDGDFTYNPVWTGDTSAWEVASGKLHSIRQLQSREKDTFYLSTASSPATATVWEFWVRLGFNTSSTNFTRIYLTSLKENPLEKHNQGYFIKIGGTEDQVSLYRQENLSTVELIEGKRGITNHSNNTLKVKVIRDKTNQWTLFTDLSGTGDRYVTQGVTRDTTYKESRYCSLVIFQSGKGASMKHWFDDIIIRPFLPDTLPPVLKNITFPDNRHLQLYFSEAVSISNLSKLNYVINGERNPDSVFHSSNDPAIVQLEFYKPFIQKETYALNLHGVTDANGNVLDTSAGFTFFIPQAYDVVIDEIYPDPTPSHGLPEQEYVEIFNTSGFPIPLRGWQFCDPVRCATFPDLILPADSLLILCDEKYESLFSHYGRTIGLKGFPTLNNGGDELFLKDNHGKIIHAVSYAQQSYADDEKAKGGWSVEMQYPEKHPCLVSQNWSASQNPSGGSPGKPNTSVNNTEKPHLRLEYIAIKDSITLIAGFNAGLNPKSLKLKNFNIPGQEIDSVNLLQPLFTQVILHLKKPLKKRNSYTLTVHDIKSCGLTLASHNTMPFGIPEKPLPGDLFINELLFNPRTGGSDFIELFSSSKKIFDIRSLYLANRNKNQEINTILPISVTPFYIFPNQYVVITTDKQNLLEEYFCRYPKNIVEINKLPSYPNISGAVVLLDTGKNTIDEVSYREEMQYALFHNYKGVSLEKINTTGPSNDPDNWASASSLSGYATPTYKNSQTLSNDNLKINFEVKPRIFSPDGDGFEDQTFLTYKLRPGFSATIDVFNENGKLVRNLQSHISLGTQNKIPWDGRNDKGNILATGIYIFNIILYHPEGTVRHIKLPVVLAKRK